METKKEIIKLTTSAIEIRIATNSKSQYEVYYHGICIDKLCKIQIRERINIHKSIHTGSPAVMSKESKKFNAWTSMIYDDVVHSSVVECTIDSVKHYIAAQNAVAAAQVEWKSRKSVAQAEGEKILSDAQDNLNNVMAEFNSLLIKIQQLQFL